MENHVSQFTNKIDIQFGQVFETWSTWQESTWERGRCHNPSGMLIFLCSFVDDLHALSLTKVASTPFSRSLGGCRLTLEFRLTVANDKIGAILPSCSPPCKSHTVTSVRLTDYSCHCCTGIHHHFRLLYFYSEMHVGRVAYDLMNPSSPSPSSLPFYMFYSSHSTLSDSNLVFVQARFHIFSESESVWYPPLFSLSAP